MSGCGALACLLSGLNIHFQPWGQPAPCRVPVASTNLTKFQGPSGQLNKTACGGARHLGNGGACTGRAFSFRWVSILSMTIGSSMQVITLTAPPHLLHVSISILNTRLRQSRRWSIYSLKVQNRLRPAKCLEHRNVSFEYTTAIPRRLVAGCSWPFLTYLL